MWNIRAHGKTDFFINIEPDDVVFVAVLKKGPTVHINKSSLVRCHHVAEYDENVFLSFPMTILDATSILIEFPESTEDGLMARWKLVIPKSPCIFPNIQIIEMYTNVSEFIIDASSESNPEWIRKSYLNIY